MNQGKLDVVKQQMARVNIDSLGISELKWTGMGEFTNGNPIDYTVEVTNRFKGLDLIECLKSYGWRFVTFYRRW